MTEKELTLLLAHLTEQADRARRTGTTRSVVDELLVLLLVDVGLRPRELCALALKDVLARDGQTCLRVPERHGAPGRTVEVPERVDRALARFTRFHRKGARLTDPLVLSERGTSLSYMSLYSKIRRLGREAGIAALNPRALRFAFLRRLYDRERDLRYVQEQAGHAHLKTTAKYVRALTRCPETSPHACSDEHADRKERPEHGGPTGAPSCGPIGPGRGMPRSPSQTNPACESCGRSVATEEAVRIDSGQFLCPGCLADLRELRP